MKKNNQMNRFIILLLTLSLLGVFYLSFKDVFMPEAQQFEMALKADYAKEYKKAEKYYQLASKSKEGDLKKLSFYYLGMLYKKKDAGNLQNYKKSEQYLEKSAVLGVKQAQYELSLLYHAGDKIPENIEKALLYMEMAVKQEFAPAEYVWAVWLERGYMGKINAQEVLSFYEKSAQKGYMPAIKGLALIYKFGNGDVLPDAEKARYWYEQISK